MYTKQTIQTKETLSAVLMNEPANQLSSGVGGVHGSSFTAVGACGAHNS